jgi:ketosteroid isomerase-like protein
MKHAVAVLLALTLIAIQPAAARSILHGETTAPPEVAEAIEQIVFAWAAKFNRGDWTRIQDTWDPDEPMPMYLGEERDRWVIGQDGLSSYFNPPAFARSLMDRVNILPYRLRVRLVSEDIAIATWENRLDFKIKKRPPIQDDYRVNAFFRRKGEEWMFIHYAELAMAPMTYMEHLYRKSVSEGFPENAAPYDGNWDGAVEIPDEPELSD